MVFVLRQQRCGLIQAVRADYTTITPSLQASNADWRRGCSVFMDIKCNVECMIRADRRDPRFGIRRDEDLAI